MKGTLSKKRFYLKGGGGKMPTCSQCFLIWASRPVVPARMHCSSEYKHKQNTHTMTWLIVLTFIDWMVPLKASLGMANLKIFPTLVEVSAIPHCRATGAWNSVVPLLRSCCRTVSPMSIFRFWAEHWLSSTVIRKRTAMLWFHIVFNLTPVFARRKIGSVVLKAKDSTPTNLATYVITSGLT